MRELGDSGEYQVRAMLNILIVDAVLFFNVGKSMGKQQVVQTVDLVMDDYKHFKPEDFKLCFKNACKGYYNPKGLFDRMDGQVVLDWLMQYDNERDGEIESIQARKNRDYKKEQEKGTPLMIAAASGQFDDDEIFKSNMSKLKRQLEENKRKRDEAAKANAIEVFDKGPVYEMHQRWLKQFTELSIKQARWKGIRMVQKYGKWLDVSAYLEYKQGQYNTILLKLEDRQTQVTNSKYIL